MPRLEAALLADSAQDYGGKVSILGAFISIVSMPSFPSAWVVQFVGRVAFSKDELRDTHEVEISVTDNSAETILKVAGSMGPNAVQSHGVMVEMGANIVLPLFLNFEGPGLYMVKLEVDGREMATLPLHVQLQSIEP